MGCTRRWVGRGETRYTGPKAVFLQLVLAQAAPENERSNKDGT